MAGGGSSRKANAGPGLGMKRKDVGRAWLRYGAGACRCGRLAGCWLLLRVVLVAPCAGPFVWLALAHGAGVQVPASPPRDLCGGATAADARQPLPSQHTVVHWC